ncbi:MAG TPA: DUF1552 domain-containing protein [Polyangia bacterium]
MQHQIRYRNRFDKQRRDILKTLGLMGVTPALLRASTLVGGVVMGRVAEAQMGGAQKSLILCHTGGALGEHWAPRGGLVLGAMSAPFEPVKGEMNFVVNGKMTGGGHGIMFHRYNDGSFNKDSFDVNLGRTVGANRPIKFLNLGVETKDKNLSRQGSTGIPPIDDPETAFNRLFGGGVTSGAPTAGGPVTVGTTAGPRKAIVDLHKKAIDALRTKLGSHEKTKIDNHLTAISEMQKRLQAPGQMPTTPAAPPPMPPASCAKPAMPSGAGRSFDEVAKLQIEMAVLALKCELTASVSLAFGNDSHNYQVLGYGECHRSHHCCGDSVAEYTKTVSYMSGLCARALARVKEEGLLASTIVTQVADMGDARSHGNDNVPLFVAGAGIKKGAITPANGRTQMDIFQVVAQLLHANEHPDARVWSANPLAGLTA